MVQISDKCEEMAEKSENTWMKKDLDQSRIADDKEPVQNLKGTITSICMCTPFTLRWSWMNCKPVYWTCSSTRCSEGPQAKEAWQLAHQCFIKERLTGDEKTFFYSKCSSWKHFQTSATELRTRTNPQICPKCQHWSAWSDAVNWKNLRFRHERCSLLKPSPYPPCL